MEASNHKLEGKLPNSLLFLIITQSNFYPVKFSLGQRQDGNHIKVDGRRVEGSGKI